jgi:hypothetical protein
MCRGIEKLWEVLFAKLNELVPSSPRFLLKLFLLLLNLSTIKRKIIYLNTALDTSEKLHSVNIKAITLHVCI